ncbi:acyl-CoA N-acyltransferase [Neocallimastix lanati (nom. inval.)]|jgi:ribosomal protein S18 acetylase RimI-like enzyme|uniref:Acyl-CoA N-acyltransferase n=1 Tax=Neocallimastix californiae TaxID=1754190 RepID=A0A1Y2C0M7_9FUNG|nr:acyl-CoA N-acyltransferase [Neocallimastix sp. JGI-2020a]ORY40582.1 acyl-CoA N-acyltransferase [Neocallimastix californiae]|eukprot:ORY40582.1 acyl-CoA N-acyltransferase [Neocallimastix californiae]
MLYNNNNNNNNHDNENLYEKRLKDINKFYDNSTVSKYRNVINNDIKEYNQYPSMLHYYNNPYDIPNTEPYINNVSLQQITPFNINSVKNINRMVFPITYNEQFYSDIIFKYNKNLSRIAVINNKAVGNICCRIEPSSNHPIMVDDMNEEILYIMTIAVLQQFRRHSIGTILLNYIINFCQLNTHIKTILLHAQITNKAAISLYIKNGFEIVDIIRGYYKNVDCPDAYLFQKKI